MKRFKFILAVCAAMVGLSASAQSWTLKGDDPVSGNSYYIYNLDEDGYVNRGKVWFGWESTVCLSDEGNIYTFTGDASSFTLKAPAGYVFTSGNNIAGDAMHDDGNSAKATNYGYTKLNNGAYHIHDAGGNASSPCWGFNSSFSANGVVAHADASADGWKCAWLFISTARFALYSAYLDATAKNIQVPAKYEEIYNNADATAEALKEATASLNALILQALLPTASDENPVDITKYVLTNPDFEDNSINGWETNYVNGQQAQNIGFQSNNTYKNNDDPKVGVISKFIEAWRPSGGNGLGDGYLRQTVSGLVEGKYVLEADAIASNQATGAPLPVGSYLYINADGVDYKTLLQTENGKPLHFSCEFLSPGDVDVTFGLKTEGSTANWIAADNFKVTFYGIDLSPYVTMLDNAVKEAMEAINKAEQQLLSEEVLYKLYLSLGQYDQEWESSKEYSTAIATIQAATAAVYANFAEYEKIAADIEAFKKNYPEGDASVLEEKYNTGNYWDYADFYPDLHAAKIAALPQTDGTDYTDLIINPGFETGDFTGWTTDDGGAASKELLVVSSTDGRRFSGTVGNYSVNVWSPSVPFPTMSISQEITDLPAGVYTISANLASHPNFEIKFSANGNTTTVFGVDKSTNVKGEVTCTLGTPGSLIITISQTRPSDGSGDGTFFKVDDLHMTYSVIKDLVFNAPGDETFQTTTNKDNVYTDITSTVTSNGTLAGKKDNLKDGIRIVYQNTDVWNEDYFTAGFVAEADIDDNAGTVYHVRAREIDGVIKLAQGLFGPNQEYTVNLKPIIYYNFDAFCDDNATDLSTTYGKALDYCDPLPLWTNGNSYTFTVTTDGSVKQDIPALVKTNTVTAFNAWGEDITADLLGQGGIATGVDKVENASADAVIYNLAGQRVGKAVKGLYIQDGKKVAVK